MLLYIVLKHILKHQFKTFACYFFINLQTDRRSLGSVCNVLKRVSIASDTNFNSDGRNKMGSCHVTQSEQKKKHGKFFWLKFLKNTLLRHNTQANAYVPLYTAVFGCEVRIFNQQKNI